MNNGAFIRGLASSGDIPVVVKDGDMLYQIQSVVEHDNGNFLVINLGGPFSPSAASQFEPDRQPVGLPEDAPEDGSASDEETVAGADTIPESQAPEVTPGSSAVVPDENPNAPDANTPAATGNEDVSN